MRGGIGVASIRDEDAEWRCRKPTTVDQVAAGHRSPGEPGFDSLRILRKFQEDEVAFDCRLNRVARPLQFQSNAKAPSRVVAMGLLLMG